MNLPAEAAPAAAPRTALSSIHWNRWSVFLSLTGLAVIIPSFIVPAMLVANALEGPRLFSVMTGIRELWRTNHGFLAGLILVFSVIFPVIKLLLTLLCAAGRSLLSHRKRRALIFLASWTAKYSMLDVLVVAVLVMTVKVGDYVHVEASRGIYMFCFAIVCSALSGAFLEMGLVREAAAPPTDRRRWKLHAILLIAGSALAVWGWQLAQRESGGHINSIHMTRLTERGELKRSIEKTFALHELTKEGHEFFSQDTWKRLVEFSQTVSTDAGWQKPEAFLRLYRKDGTMMETKRIKEVNFDDDALVLDFPMPEPVAWNDLDHMRLVSNVSYTRFLNAEVEEENVRTDGETYSLWTRQWYGRVYAFDLRGPRGKRFIPALALTTVALAAAFSGMSGLLAGTKKRKLGARNLPVTAPA
jgi:paraquat-inducible protein A